MPVPASNIIHLFNQCFEHTEHTILQGDADEPLYQPSPHKSDTPNHTEASHPNIIYFTKDYTSSALHEIAHWTLAGKERRTQIDYGYWYEPDGRTHAQQALFEKVEVKPQAIEKLFSNACGQPFTISADNLESGIQSSNAFEQSVHTQAQRYQTGMDALPPRAALFLGALKRRFKSV